MNIYTIYRATNIINGKVYIGFDSSWPARQQQHKYSAYTFESNYKFHKALRKYGWDNFIWEAIYQSLEYEYTLETVESKFIHEHNSIKCGYNTLDGGTSWIGSKNPMKNPEIVSKMSGENHYTQSPGFVETRKGKTHYNHNNTIYVWQNIKTGEICRLTRYQFRLKTNASESNLSFYINGVKGKSVKGWRIISTEE